MKRKHLFLVVLLMEMAFIAIPQHVAAFVWHPFLFNGYSIQLHNYVYETFQHWVGGSILMAVFLVIDSKPHERWTNISFLIIQGFDWLDYVATDNQTWFDVGIPVTGNIVKIVAFAALTWRTDIEKTRY